MADKSNKLIDGIPVLRPNLFFKGKFVSRDVQ
jgi:hypothetical protein